MKLSVKELLKIATDHSSEIATNNKPGINDVHRFIMTLGIKEGKHVVKNRLLYKSYCMWSAKPLSLIGFHMQFATFFVQQRTVHYRYYNLNYRPIELINKVDNKKIKIRR